MSAFEPVPVLCVRCKVVLRGVPSEGSDLAALSECPACGRRFGKHLRTWLPTDDDTIQLFDDVVARLHQDTDEYTFEEACSLVEGYYRRFTDAAVCARLGVPVQNDDFFHQEGAAGVALRVHYYLKLQGNPDPRAFIEWRAGRSRDKA